MSFQNNRVNDTTISPLADSSLAPTRTTIHSSMLAAMSTMQPRAVGSSMTTIEPQHAVPTTQASVPVTKPLVGAALNGLIRLPIGEMRVVPTESIPEPFRTLTDQAFFYNGRCYGAAVYVHGQKNTTLSGRIGVLLLAFDCIVSLCPLAICDTEFDESCVRSPKQSEFSMRFVAISDFDLAVRTFADRTTFAKAMLHNKMLLEASGIPVDSEWNNSAITPRSIQILTGLRSLVMLDSTESKSCTIELAVGGVEVFMPTSLNSTPTHVHKNGPLPEAITSLMTSDERSALGKPFDFRGATQMPMHYANIVTAGFPRQKSKSGTEALLYERMNKPETTYPVRGTDDALDNKYGQYFTAQNRSCLGPMDPNAAFLARGTEVGMPVMVNGKPTFSKAYPSAIRTKFPLKATKVTSKRGAKSRVTSDDSEEDAVETTSKKRKVAALTKATEPRGRKRKVVNNNDDNDDNDNDNDNDDDATSPTVARAHSQLSSTSPAVATQLASMISSTSFHTGSSGVQQCLADAFAVAQMVSVDQNVIDSIAQQSVLGSPKHDETYIEGGLVGRVHSVPVTIAPEQKATLRKACDGTSSQCLQTLINTQPELRRYVVDGFPISRQAVLQIPELVIDTPTTSVNINVLFGSDTPAKRTLVAKFNWGVIDGFNYIVRHQSTPERFEHSEAVDEQYINNSFAPDVELCSQTLIEYGKPVKRFGARAKKAFKAGEFIGWYHGEFLAAGEPGLDGREAIYRMAGSPPTNDDDYSIGSLTCDGVNGVVSAARPEFFASALRAANDSSNPNAATEENAVFNKDIRGVAVYALVDIEIGDAICLDYGDAFRRKTQLLTGSKMVEPLGTSAITPLRFTAPTLDSHATSSTSSSEDVLEPEASAISVSAFNSPASTAALDHTNSKLSSRSVINSPSTLHALSTTTKSDINTIENPFDHYDVDSEFCAWYGDF